MKLNRCLLIMRALQDEPLQVRTISLSCELAYTKASAYLNFLISKELVVREMFGGKYHFRLTDKGFDAGRALKKLEELKVI